MLSVSARSGRPLPRSSFRLHFCWLHQQNPTLPPLALFLPKPALPSSVACTALSGSRGRRPGRGGGDVSRRGSRSKPYSPSHPSPTAPPHLRFPFRLPSPQSTRVRRERILLGFMSWHAWKAGTLDLSPVAAGFVAARAPSPLPWVDCRRGRGVSAQELWIRDFFRSEF